MKKYLILFLLMLPCINAYEMVVDGGDIQIVPTIGITIDDNMSTSGFYYGIYTPDYFIERSPTDFSDYYNYSYIDFVWNCTDLNSTGYNISRTELYVNYSDYFSLEYYNDSIPNASIVWFNVTWEVEPLQTPANITWYPECVYAEMMENNDTNVTMNYTYYAQDNYNLLVNRLNVSLAICPNMSYLKFVPDTNFTWNGTHNETFYTQDNVTLVNHSDCEYDFIFNNTAAVSGDLVLRTSNSSSGHTLKCGLTRLSNESTQISEDYSVLDLTILPDSIRRINCWMDYNNATSPWYIQWYFDFFGG